MKIAILAARDGAWLWQHALADALAVRHEVRRFAVAGGALPVLMRALLALEARICSRSKTATLQTWEGSAEGFDPGAFDLVIDFTGATPGALTLTYDGEAEERFLWGRLLDKQLPMISVCRSGKTLAASLAAIEDQIVLSRGLGFAFARARVLIERAVEIVEGGRHVALLPEPFARLPIGYSTLALASFALARVGASLMVLLRKRGHWIVALRRGGEDYAYVPARAGHFLADPMLFTHQGQAFLFVEDLDYTDNKGRIAVAQLGDGAPVFELALEEPHHLSYPFVFAHEDEIYMMPECGGAGRQIIYRATSFPTQWVRHAELFEGAPVCDATIVEHGDRFWLFCTQPATIGSNWDELSIFHGPSPLGPWTAHKLNPVKSDARGARSGGRMRKRGDRLFRPVQDCSGGYGAKLAWYEVTDLTTDTFTEARVSEWDPRKCGVFTGLHTYDRAGEWEVIDLKMDRPRKGATHPRFTQSHQLKAPDAD